MVTLLIAMGYGGCDASMGRVTGRTGDGGIDATIREDKLGLDEVYESKPRSPPAEARWALATFGNLVGALVGAHARKGVFGTTADFTASAKDFAAQDPGRVVLISGRRLARLMVRHDAGVRVRDPQRPPIPITAIDEDFFDQGWSHRDGPDGCHHFRASPPPPRPLDPAHGSINTAGPNGYVRSRPGRANGIRFGSADKMVGTATVTIVELVCTK